MTTYKDFTLADWQAKAASLKIENRAFINGKYVAAQEGQTFPCISPIDGKELTQIARCTSTDADLAVNAAKTAFQAGTFSQLAPAKRKQVLLNFAQLIEDNAEELALLESLDMGKPIRFSLAIDVKHAANSLRWTAEAIDKFYGELAPTAPNQLGLISYQPVGVVACIVPWNFPLLMACWKFAPALAMGNSVILKPSEKSSLTAIKIAGLATEAGIPAGVFNLLTGLGREVGKALALHNQVDAIAFTGSTATAKQLQIYAGQSNMKRVWLEAGGKSANIVFADAPDLTKAARAAAQAIAFNLGQVCTAGSRLLVENSIKEEFTLLVVEALARWQPSHPLDPNSVNGALVDEIQLNKVQSYLQLGQEEGAELIVGGKQPEIATGGYYLEPSVFSQVSNSSRLAQEEIFGPVLAIVGFDTQEEALSLANDSIYGLAAAVWTSNLSKAYLMAKGLEAGTVWVNNYDTSDMTVPFGGFKQSGIGRDKSLHAFSKYVELKTTWISL